MVPCPCIHRRYKWLDHGGRQRLTSAGRGRRVASLSEGSASSFDSDTRRCGKGGRLAVTACIVDKRRLRLMWVRWWLLWLWLWSCMPGAAPHRKSWSASRARQEQTMTNAAIHVPSHSRAFPISRHVSPRSRLQMLVYEVVQAISMCIGDQS